MDWEGHFHSWMQSQGHKRARGEDSYWQELHYPHLTQDEARQLVYHFNTSAWLINMPPFRDARSGIARLRDAGYRFHAITAMGDTDVAAVDVRRVNLERLFGYDTFVEITATDMYDPNSKVETLSRYKDSGLPWLEDKPSNAEIGVRLGLDTYLFEHPHNEEYLRSSSINGVSSWTELCGKLLN